MSNIFTEAMVAKQVMESTNDKTDWENVLDGSTKMTEGKNSKIQHVRYEFNDGSAIVIAEFGGWNLGVHRSRLIDAERRLTADMQRKWNSDPLPNAILYAWAIPDMGLTEQDALPL